MPLQRDTSSAIYWKDAGLDDPDVDEAVLRNLEQKDVGSSRIHAGHKEEVGESYDDPAGSVGAQRTSQRVPSVNATTPINQQVNKQETLKTMQASKNSNPTSARLSLMNDNKDIGATDQSPEEDDDEEEITFNPDMELQDAQAAQHGYESAQFYEKINFGEFSKYMANKRRKLGVQQGAFKLNAKEDETSSVLKGLRIHVSYRLVNTPTK